MELAPSPWAGTQSRYVAYCLAHGATSPEEMLARDTEQYPGGCMTGYILWISWKWREWPGAAWDHEGFDAWLAPESDGEKGGAGVG
jgi:hypothetical protein